jgi:hypothetical protein
MRYALKQVERKSMIKPVSVTALSNYRIHIAFSDGAEGDVDLSDLARQGVFAAWSDRRFFEGVHVGSSRQGSRRAFPMKSRPS